MLDGVTKSVEAGESRYVIFEEPFRHGKSDIASKRWPAWHEIRNPDHEFIIGTYGAELSQSMSYENRTLLRDHGEDYGVVPQSDRQSVGSWRLASPCGDLFKGAIHAVGLRGVVTGRGANILAVDDYYKNREEAESPTIRQKVWDGFVSDLMTRLAPVHGVAIVANRWKDTDLVGKIKNKNNPAHEDYDPKFPVFEVFTHSAYNEETDTYLFEERFSREWYEKQRAMLGTYAWSSQGQQEPIARGGNRFKTGPGHIVYHTDLNDFPDMRYYRFWDPAATEAERGSADPDSTVGALVGVQVEDGLEHVWIKDIVRGKWEAPERNRRIVETAKKETNAVGVESVGGFKEAYDVVRAALKGIRMVSKQTVSKDKGVRAEPLEAIFEAGNIHVMRTGWTNVFVEEFSAFPDGTHDDIVDAVSGGYHMAKKHMHQNLGFGRGSIGM